MLSSQLEDIFNETAFTVLQVGPRPRTQAPPTFHSGLGTRLAWLNLLLFLSESGMFMRD